MKILVLNCGSSSVKYKLFDMQKNQVLSSGIVEKIGMKGSFLKHQKENGNQVILEGEILEHQIAVEYVLGVLTSKKHGAIKSIEEIKAVGHRVVHGGESFNTSVLITEEVIEKIKDCISIAPLHNPPNLAGIYAIEDLLPDVPQVAVFDTAYHQTMPDYAYMYGIPYALYQKYGIRRYGFHGTSHKYITMMMKEKLGRDDVNLIICHVGSGASVTCVRDGKCFDTSMGLTPLDGLIMGTRSGEVDPSIIKFMADEAGMNVDYITDILNKKSGLLGICGKNDFRDVVALSNSGDERGRLAYKMFMDAIIKHIAEYYFELEGKLDAIVFCAGVLENNVMLREDIINSLSHCMSLKLDKESNDNIGYGHDESEGIITTKDSDISVYVLPTNEEVMIVRDTYRLINSC